MTIIRDFNNSENIINYLGTLAFFCAISCTIIMLKFRGFRASLNFGTQKGANVEHYETYSGVSITGAYKSSNEFVGNINYPNPPKRIRPSMVKLPNLQPTSAIKPSKSTNDLISSQTEATNITNSTPNISQANNNNDVQLTKDQIKQQKNLEKQRLAEQKKRDKLAAQEQKKREKIAAQEQKKEKLAAEQQQKRDKLAAQEQQKREKLAAQEQQKREKLAAKEQQKQEKLRKEAEKRGQQNRSVQEANNAPNRSAPPPPPLPTNQPVANPQTQRLAAYSTNTLESSISRSSGPPPYTSVPEVVPNELDDTGNTSFSKPVGDSGSWDMISQHRQQLHRPAGVSKGAIQQKPLNLNYNVASSKVSQDNSDA